jgi:hypothetical protein
MIIKSRWGKTRGGQNCKTNSILKIISDKININQENMDQI